MKQKEKVPSRELGLDIALIYARYLFNTDHLHYGLWTDGLAIEPGNLRQAQENYCDMIVAQIPPGVKTILDVGAGTGALAHRLIAEGYTVDCVSPSPFLTARARAVLGETPQIFECRYEDMVNDKRYDLVLFSESFQYIKLEQSLAISHEHLNPGGHILVSDFFRNDNVGKSPMGGGHSLAAFRDEIARHPLHVLVDKDITPQTAPNLDLVADLTENVMAPTVDRVAYYLENNHRFLHWLLLKVIFRKTIARAREKYLTGKRRGANFLIFKSYRVVLCQDCQESSVGAANARKGVPVAA